MIRIDDDYYIDVDGREAKFKAFEAIAYYGSLSGAVSGLAKYLAMQKFSAGEYKLWEAVEEIRKINKGLSDLIEKYEDDLK